MNQVKVEIIINKAMTLEEAERLKDAFYTFAENLASPIIKPDAIDVAIIDIS